MIDFTGTVAYLPAYAAPVSDLADASCTRANPRLFTDDRCTEARLRKAQDLYCGACPVVNACYEGAVARRESGIWGGRLLDIGRDVTAELTARSSATVTPAAVVGV